MVDARRRDERKGGGDDHQDRRGIDERQQQLPREPAQPRGNALSTGLGHGCPVSYQLPRRGVGHPVGEAAVQ